MCIVKLAFLLGVALFTEGLPQFKWDTSLRSSSGVPNLVIYSDDGMADRVILERYNPNPEVQRSTVDSCIFKGYLESDLASAVTLSGGCSFKNSFEIQILSSRSHNGMYKVENDVVRKLPSPYSMEGPNGERNIFGSISEQNLEMFIKNKMIGATNRADYPPQGFQLLYVAWYDQLFKAFHGANAEAKIDSVMAFVQDFYRLPTLNTTIRFVQKAKREIPDSFTEGAAETSLNLMMKYLTETDVNAHVVFTFQNNTFGVVGLAYVGSVCEDPRIRQSMNEYFQTDAQTGQIVAHEIGHNLNMSHDFLSDQTQPRLDSKGNTCKNIGGIMDYDQAVFNRWSTCSVEDMKAYHDNRQPYCLKSDIITTTTTTSTSTTTTTTTPTKTPTPTPTTQTTGNNPCTTTFKTACSTLCQSVSFSGSYNCIASTPTSTSRCNCAIYLPITTTKPPTQPAPTPTTTSLAQLCNSVGGACVPLCRSVNFANIYTCVISTPARVYRCQCGLFSTPIAG